LLLSSLKIQEMPRMPYTLVMDTTWMDTGFGWSSHVVGREVLVVRLLVVDEEEEIVTGIEIGEIEDHHQKGLTIESLYQDSHQQDHGRT